MSTTDHSAGSISASPLPGSGSGSGPLLLSLDIDGVLHPSTEVQDFAATGLPFAAYLQSRPHLLRWLPLLSEALRGSSCEIVIHSTWREHLLDADFYRLLGPSGLADRLIGSAPRGLPREAAILSVCRTLGLAPEDVLVLDDAHSEFDVLSSRLVVCNPLRGINDPSVLAALRKRVGGLEHAAAPAQPEVEEFTSSRPSPIDRRC